MIEINDIKLAQQGDEEDTEKIFNEYHHYILRINRKFFHKGTEPVTLH